MSSLFWQHSGFDQWKVAYKFVMSHVLNKPCNTSTIYPILWIKVKYKQGNREDMREIRVTRYFFEANGHQDNFFEKTKNPFLDKV